MIKDDRTISEDSDDSLITLQSFEVKILSFLFPGFRKTAAERRDRGLKYC